jgi:hypothetical protein
MEAAEMNVVTGFGYFTEIATGRIVAKATLPAGEHPLDVAYSYTEVADQAALDAIEITPALPRYLRVTAYDGSPTTVQGVYECDGSGWRHILHLDYIYWDDQDLKWYICNVEDEALFVRNDANYIGEYTATGQGSTGTAVVSLLTNGLVQTELENCADFAAVREWLEEFGLPILRY